jgi:hypothetical protein
MKIYNNFLTEQDKEYLKSIIKSPRWKWGHFSKIDDNNYFWKIPNLEFDLFFSPYLLNKIKELTGEDLIIQAVYMNGHTACSHGTMHKDGDDDFGRTFIIYCNPEWNIEWGGGTYFAETDTIVNCKPYSAVYFQNNLEHFATPLSKDFKGLRVTLVFKLLRADHIII